ncbi:MAG: hypothetical protein CVT73_08290 [Alphaproteobacteria bacterium HGW-Alphaproteobacteria-12]|nr:MAG: hypothetical protein CVT73_08290 [Alphaproteobacteria bacterium HGW-Alphaproteobacteria-12]
MNQLLLTPEEGALKALGVACQSASRFYETAADITHESWRAFANRRREGYAGAARRVTGLLRRDELLPGTPDEDMEWLKGLAMRAQAAISGDEAGTLLKSFMRTERKVWHAIGEFGLAGIGPDGADTAKDIADFVMAGFLWLGEEKKAFLTGEDG